MGPGFLERVYENALAYEISRTGLKVRQQFPITVRYQKVVVGEYVADLMVEEALLVEIRAVDKLNKTDNTQCLNRLKATGIKACLLINFGKAKVKIKRIINRS